MRELVLDMGDAAVVEAMYRIPEERRRKGGVLRATGPGPTDPTRRLPKPWRSVLEVGCGLDQWMAGLVSNASTPATIYALDLSLGVLSAFPEDLRRAVPDGRTAPELRRVLGDGQRMPFVDESFDGVSAVLVPQHMPNVDDFISEAARVLVDDGWLVMTAMSLDFPEPDLPSAALTRLLGQPARFRVRNCFPAPTARSRLSAAFERISTWVDPLPSELTSPESMVKFHSRLEHPIRHALPLEYEWGDYISVFEDVSREYLQTHRVYAIEFPIAYHLAEQPRRESRQR